MPKPAYQTRQMLIPGNELLYVCERLIVLYALYTARYISYTSECMKYEFSTRVRYTVDKLYFHMKEVQ